LSDRPKKQSLNPVQPTTKKVVSGDINRKQLSTNFKTILFRNRFAEKGIELPTFTVLKLFCALAEFCVCSTQNKKHVVHTGVCLHTVSLTSRILLVIQITFTLRGFGFV